MTPTTFDAPWTLDTNVLVYATEPDAPLSKQGAARSLMGGLTISAHACLVGQVMGEYMTVALRKNVTTRAGVLELMTNLATGVKVLGASPGCYQAAFELVARHHYQLWDALIIAVCAEHGVKTLYSEDAGSLKRPLGVHVINPFTHPVGELKTG